MIDSAGIASAGKGKPGRMSVMEWDASVSQWNLGETSISYKVTFKTFPSRSCLCMNKYIYRNSIISDRH